MTNWVNLHNKLQYKPMEPHLKVQKLSHKPTRLWQKWSVKQHHEKVEPMPLETPLRVDALRCVAISDTHSRQSRMQIDWVPGDVLLHAGDFTMIGEVNEVVQFNEWMSQLPYQHKLVIAGNHEVSFDDKIEHSDEMRMKKSFDNMRKYLAEHDLQHPADLLTNCTYMLDNEVSIHGVKFWGSPHQPEFYDWGFNVPRGQELLELWNKIPDDTDVLMTHGPPLGHGDRCISDQRAGCAELLTTIQERVKPKFHVFGHIHEDYGITTDGVTTYINASTVDIRYRVSHLPIVFDVPLPPGQEPLER